MLRGRTFRLTSPTLGVNQKSHVAGPVPDGAVVHVIREFSHEGQMVEVEFDGSQYLMFALDLMHRGEEVQSPPARESATAAPSFAGGSDLVVG